LNGNGATKRLRAAHAVPRYWQGREPGTDCCPWPQRFVLYAGTALGLGTCERNEPVVFRHKHTYMRAHTRTHTPLPTHPSAFAPPRLWILAICVTPVEQNLLAPNCH